MNYALIITALNKYIHILVFLLFLSFIYGCKSDSENHAEGVIEYQVSYPKMEKTNFMLDFMPRKMTMSFRRDIYSTQLTAGMGMFRSSFICDKGKENLFKWLSSSTKNMLCS